VEKMNNAEGDFNRKEEDQIYDSPQKWFIREKWAQHATIRRDSNRRSYIRLLTLTSTKTYDINIFKEKGLIATTNSGYLPESLTFCECVPERFARIHNRLPGARGFLGTFEDFVGAGAIGQSKRANMWFPYDVINLDFTDPCFKQRGKKTSRTMDAIEKTFYFQKIKKQSFTLFLTIPALKKGDDPTGISQLDECLDTNMRNRYRDFKEKFFQKYPRRRFRDYREFLLFVVPKLIIRYGQNSTFDISCKERFTYINEGARAVMITFVFDCEYVGLPNGYGGENPSDILSRLYPQRIMELLERDFEDINEKLRQNQGLLEHLGEIKKKY
jgi:hypothetical protein